MNTQNPLELNAEEWSDMKDWEDMEIADQSHKNEMEFLCLAEMIKAYSGKAIGRCEDCGKVVVQILVDPEEREVRSLCVDDEILDLI